MDKENQTPKDDPIVENEDTKVEVKVKASEESPEEVSEVSTEEVKSEEPELSEEEKLTLKVEELEAKILRRAAEFENFKKRTARQFDDMAKAGTERVISELLEVVDNFKRSLEHEDNGNDLEAFKEGIKLIYNQMSMLLEKYDVKPIEAIGKKFDPNYHEALMQLESDEFEPDTIALEIGRGYTISGKVIRHSKVGVSTGKKTDSDNANDDGDDNKE